MTLLRTFDEIKSHLGHTLRNTKQSQDKNSDICDGRCDLKFHHFVSLKNLKILSFSMEPSHKNRAVLKVIYLCCPLRQMTPLIL